MEHCAAAVGMDPLEFRLKNALKPGDAVISGGTMGEEGTAPAVKLIEQVRTSAKFDERRQEVQQFNQV